MLLRSGTQIDQSKLLQDQIFASAWAILLSQGSHLFTIEDIESLRLTCKLTKQLATPLMTKLSFNTAELFTAPDSDDFEAGNTIIFPPLLDTIRSMEVFASEFEDGYFKEWDDLATKGFRKVMRKATSLKILELVKAQSLTFFYNTPLPSLETLKISKGNIYGTFKLPSSLVHLELHGTRFKSSSAARRLFTSGAFPHLKTLHMYNSYIGDDYEAMIIRKIAIRDCDPMYNGTANYNAGREFEDALQEEMRRVVKEPSNWSYIMPRLKFPSLESLILNEVQGLGVTDAYRIGKAAENLPRLKDYVAPFYVNSRYDSVYLDVNVARKFFESSICARMEDMDVSRMYLSDEGFDELVKTASNLQKLKRFTVDTVGKRKIKKMAEAGASGGFPLLEKFSLRVSEEFANPRDLEQNYGRAKDQEWWLNYCKEKLHSVWPGLEIEVREVALLVARMSDSEEEY